MKQGTSFFNAAALRKNLTRFAPAWGIYGILMLLVVLSRGNLDEVGFAEGMAISAVVMVIINFGYALLNAQLLFGDLFNSRMCNALHAMPLRREGWFLTNVASGLLFSLIPNTAISLLCAVICREFWAIPALWLCAVTMEYLFFFGVAVLSAYLVGHRFAMGLVYVILNGFSLILYWLVYSIFEPMLYGVTVQMESFVDFCPLVKLCTFTYLDIYWENMQAFWQFADGWGYLGICAGIGVAALALGLLCYRKRNLETAGDFAAMKPVAPVFLVLYTICGGACCHGFFSLFLGEENEVFLFLGLAIGYFTGKMLLQRTVRVFKFKTFLGFGAVVLAMVLSIVAVQTDLLGIVCWVPKAEQVASVSITTGGSYNYQYNRLTLTEAEDIENILEIHRYGLENRDEGSNGVRDTRVMLRYTLRSGAVREREYYVDVDTPCADVIRKYISHPRVVLGQVYEQQDIYTLYGVELPETGLFVVSQEALEQLTEAILADCAEGNLPQDWSYLDAYDKPTWLTLEYRTADGMHYYTELRFTPMAKHLTAWYNAQPDPDTIPIG